MLLQDSEGKSPNLSKNRYRINIPIVAWENERNIQPISQCYTGILTEAHDVISVLLRRNAISTELLTAATVALQASIHIYK